MPSSIELDQMSNTQSLKQETDVRGEEWQDPIYRRSAKVLPSQMCVRDLDGDAYTSV